MFKNMQKKTRLRMFLLIPLSSILIAAQAPIPASKASISIGTFTFRITAVVFDQNALGFAPPDMKASDRIIFVEFKLLAGDVDDFKDLTVPISCEAGQEFPPVLLTSGGVVKMLATMTMKGRPGNYRPHAENIAWAYVVSREATKFHLHFPSGEVVDLTPLIH
jgi:hypothetical protein